jgi:hypothetical protein
MLKPGRKSCIYIISEKLQHSNYQPVKACIVLLCVRCFRVLAVNNVLLRALIGLTLIMVKGRWIFCRSSWYIGLLVDI